MNGSEKYLFEVRLEALRDTAPLSDADLDAILDTTGSAADSARHNPESLSAGGLADALGDIVQTWRRSTLALCGLMQLDSGRVVGTFDALADFRGLDPLTVLCELTERELSRRGPVARSLTRWLLKNVFTFTGIQDANGWDRKQMGDAIAAHLQGEQPDYAWAVASYFDPEQEHLDTDCKAAACCVLLALDYDAVMERAGILEFDDGLPRTAATMRAVWFALRERQPRISEQGTGLFFDLSSAALEAEESNGWKRAKTIDWLMERLNGTPLAVPFPAAKAVAI